MTGPTTKFFIPPADPPILGLLDLEWQSPSSFNFTFPGDGRPSLQDAAEQRESSLATTARSPMAAAARSSGGVTETLLQASSATAATRSSREQRWAARSSGWSNVNPQVERRFGSQAPKLILKFHLFIKSKLHLRPQTYTEISPWSLILKSFIWVPKTC